MSTYADATRARAAELDHAWDRRAIEWPLTHDSVVVEVGGYTGRWALQIAERYHPRLFVFEPQRWAAEVCRDVLRNWNDATVASFGLGITNDKCTMDKWGTDGCSLVDEGIVGDEWGDAQIREIGEVFKFFDLTHVDLMLINIEGYEYQLIPHMLDQGIYPARLMVQFHTFADADGTQQAAIYARLAELGYHIAWTYGVVLTAWEHDA